MTQGVPYISSPWKNPREMYVTSEGLLVRSMSVPRSLLSYSTCSHTLPLSTPQPLPTTSNTLLQCKAAQSTNLRSCQLDYARSEYMFCTRDCGPCKARHTLATNWIQHVQHSYSTLLQVDRVGLARTHWQRSRPYTATKSTVYSNCRFCCGLRQQPTFNKVDRVEFNIVASVYRA